MPLFDVVRAAVLEVEDYTRVTVAPMPNSPLLVGAAVTDVIHLVAELVENAAVFSPPNTTVQVRGVTAANGMALEVEDRGLGLNDATLRELNERLADVPEFDLADSDRLGLFVVARLAARHGIKIVLRRSPYDGTTAIVLLPAGLLAEAEPLALTAGPATAGHAAGHAAGNFAQNAAETGHDAVNGRATRPVRGTWFEPDPARNRADSVPEPTQALPPEGEPVPRSASPLSGHPDLDPLRGHPDLEPLIGFGSGSAAGATPGPATTSGPPAGWSVTVPPQEADEDLDGLPMRIPQASLAPQLRVDARPERRGPSGRSPEELAQLMSSMQRGWQEGRQQAEQEPDMWNRKDDRPDA
ncbi:ATP-binding protein [Nonomuraea thailandensis]